MYNPQYIYIYIYIRSLHLPFFFVICICMYICIDCIDTYLYVHLHCAPTSNFSYQSAHGGNAHVVLSVQTFSVLSRDF